MEKKELFRIMAAADGSMLRELAQPLAEKYGVSVVKAPAKTLAMIKLREPVKNSLFYLGEALVCDTVVELGGTKGTAVVLGDDFDKVSSMAVIDAAFNRQVSELDELKTVLRGCPNAVSGNRNWKTDCMPKRWLIFRLWIRSKDNAESL